MIRGALGKRETALQAVMVAAVAVVSIAVAGCSARSGGMFGRGAGGVGDDGAGISEEGLAGAPSIEQFEETGLVAAGGAYRDVPFAFDSDRLDDVARGAVQHNAALLQADPARRVEIEGHCDERGSSEYNLALGARRARAVRDALVGMGVSADRLATVSYGEELPICKESTQGCWETNRRAHLVDLGS